MNWRRGAFRLWVCVSVLWVAGVLIYAAPHLLDNTALRDPFVEMPWPTFTAAAYSDEWVVVPVKPTFSSKRKASWSPSKVIHSRCGRGLIGGSQDRRHADCLLLAAGCFIRWALAIRWVVRGFQGSADGR